MLGQIVTAVLGRLSDYRLRAQLASILRERVDPAIDVTHVMTILMDGLVYQDQHEPISFTQLKRDVLKALGRQACPGAFFYAYQWLKEHNVIQLISYKQSLCVCLNTNPANASDQSQPIITHLQRFAA